jgi:hypothetical protein
MGPLLNRPDVLDFGREADTERLLQILHSEPVRREIVENFDLLNHYGIKDGSRFPYTALNRKFANNVRFRKTRYMAVEIEVLDTDPEIAAAMANDIARCVDSIMNLMFRDRAVVSLAIVEEEYLRLQEEAKVLADSLKRIRQLGVINYESQSEVINNAYASAILGRDTISEKFFRGRLNILSAYGGTYVNLRDNLDYHLEKLNEMKSVYDEARVNAARNMPYLYIVENASVAEKKAYPVRSLIAGASTMAAFILALFTLLLADSFRKLSWKQQKH